MSVKVDEVTDVEEVKQREKIGHFCCACRDDGAPTFCGGGLVRKRGVPVADVKEVTCSLCHMEWEAGWTCPLCGRLWKKKGWV